MFKHIKKFFVRDKPIEKEKTIFELLIEKTKNNIAFTSLIFTVFGAIINILTKVYMYCYQFGKNSFFDMGVEFLEINYEITIVSAIIYTFIIAIILIVFYSIYKRAEKLKNVDKFFTKYLDVLGFNIIITTIITVLTKSNIIVNFIVYFIIEIMLFETCIKDIYDLIENKNIKNKKRNNMSIIILIIILFYPVAFYVQGYCESCSKKEFNYIVDESDNYAVIGMFKNNYIANKCTIENNNLILETDKIKIFSLNNLEMENIKVDNIIKIKNIQ